MPSDDEFPRDDDARLVHGDVLQQRGDPLGELIALQHAGLDTTALIAQHATTWFGELANVRELFEWTWRLGRLERVRLGYTRGAAKPWLAKLEAAMPDKPLIYQLGTLVDALFALPIARQLDTLVLGEVGTGDLQHCLERLGAVAPPTLRSLAIYVDRDRRAAPGWIAPMHFAALEEFSTTLNLSLPGLAHLATARWPKLRVLAFAIHGSHDTIQPIDISDALGRLAPLLAGDGVPALRSLTVWTPSPAPLCEALIEGALLDRLEALVIHSKRPCDPEVEAALHARAPFARVEHHAAWR